MSRSRRQSNKPNFRSKIIRKRKRYQQISRTSHPLEGSARAANHRGRRRPNTQVIHGQRKRLALRSTTGANRSVFMKKTANKRRQAAVGIIMIVILVLLVTSQYIANVSVENNEGNNDPNVLALTTASQEYISKHRWYLLFEKSDYIETARHEVSALTVNQLVYHPLSHQLKVQSSRRTAKATWQTGGSNYYIDQDGIIFTNPELKKQPGLHFRDTKNVPVEPGKVAVALSTLQFVDEAEDSFKTLSISTERYEVGSDPRSINVVLNEPKINIKISSTESATPQIKDIAIGLSGLAKQGKTPVEYLDVRTPGKIFWK